MKKYIIILILLLMASLASAYTVELNMTFDSEDGTYNSTFAQEFANGWNGTVINATYQSTAGVGGSGAYYFNNSVEGSDFVYIEGADHDLSPIKFTTEDYFMSLWVKRESTVGVNIYIVGAMSGNPLTAAGYPGYAIWDNAGKPRIRIVNSSSSYPDQYINGYDKDYFPSSWTHYIMATNVSAGKIDVYIDGVKNYEAWYTNTKTSNVNDFNIGSRGSDADGFGGWIDEIIIGNGSLTREEALEIYESYAQNIDKIACIGDSITAYLPGHCSDMNDQDSYMTSNYGISGDTVQGLNDRTSNITGKGFNKTILLIGTNDRSDSAPVFYANYSLLVSTIQNDNQIVLTSTIPPVNYTYATGAEDVAKINSIVKRVSYENETCFADIWLDVFGGAYQNDTFRDNLHPTYSSMNLMNKTYTEALASCTSYDCRSGSDPEDCYNGSKYFFFESKTIQDNITALTYNLTTATKYLNFSCTGLTNQVVTNLNELDGTYGYVAVYHDGDFVEYINSDTYTISSCSEWYFEKSDYIGISSIASIGSAATGWEKSTKLLPVIVIALIFVIIIPIIFIFATPNSNTGIDMNKEVTGSVVTLVIGIGIIAIVIVFIAAFIASIMGVI